MRRKLSSSFLVVFCLLACELTTMDCKSQTILTDPLSSRDIKMAVGSKNIYHVGNEKKLVWTEDLLVEDAEWLRLKFDQVVLAGSPLGGDSSTLKITSLEDGKFQLLNAQTARQWRNTSAYFNGDAVRLELFAEPNGRLNLIEVGEVTIGQRQGGDVARTICDQIDDRVLSEDPRSARGEPIGCSCWLFNDRNNCFITAGHCAIGTDVAMFNVPLSSPTGQRRFPGPEDQYSVDPESMQFVNGGIGNDWAYFGCFPNSNTGLTAFQAQGQSYELGTPQPVQNGDQIRITGFGSTFAPVNPTWNSAQKTQVGFYSFFISDGLGYRTDTTGGNSGSPVIFEATGQVIGVHTHGGCGNGGGVNQGTSISQNAFATALNNPLGICQLTINFQFPNGLPEFVLPTGGTSVQVFVDQSDIQIDPSTAVMNVDTGSGFEAIPMEFAGNSTYVATFGEYDCGSLVRYFFSVQSVNGEQFVNPSAAPQNTYSAVSAGEVIDVQFNDSFETDLDWTVSGNASTGFWERAIPNGNGERGDPPTDADGSGACFVTENGEGNTDVDNGSVVLTSPVMDATSGANEEAVLSYFRWFDSDTSGDLFLVEISNDNGATWQNLEVINNQVGDTNGGWILALFGVVDVIEPTNEMRLRFTVSDTNDADIVEAGIDGVSINIVECSDEILLGDLNGDGVVNLLDVAPFVQLLVNETFQAEADINMDGEVNLLDVNLFIDLLGS